MSTVETAVGRFVWHDHVSGDPAAASRFYGELLGWEIEVWKPGEMDYPMIKSGGSTHGGFGPAQGGEPPHWLGHVTVDDVDAAAGRVASAGGAVVAGRWTSPRSAASPSSPTRRAPSSRSSSRPATTTRQGVFVWDEVLTTDVEAAKQFYGEVVGWEARDMDMGPSGMYTLFSSDGTDRAGCMPMPPGAEGVPPNWMTYIGTDDVDGTAERAKSWAPRS